LHNGSSIPSARHRRDPYFYFKYDFLWAIALVITIAALHVLGWRGYEITVPTALAVLPLACYQT
jgi:hypothetical protein